MPGPITAKVTWFFQAGRSYGWTESFYLTAPDLTTAYNSVTQAMINARLAMLCKPYLLTGIRVTNATPGQKRQSLVEAFNLQTGLGQYPGSNPAAAGDWGGNPDVEVGEPFQALLIRMEAGIQNRRAFLLRGIPDTITDASGDYVPQAAFVAAFNKWRSLYLAQNTAWGVRVMTPGVAVLPTGWTVPNNGFGVQFNLAQAIDPAWVRDQVVRISGILGAANLVGTWKIAGPGVVTGVAPNAIVTYTLQPKQRPVYGVPNLSGVIRALTQTIAPFTAIMPERGVKKSTGRPSAVSRGRARVRRN